MIFTVLFTIPFLIGLLIGAALFVLIVGTGTIFGFLILAAEGLKAFWEGLRQGERQARAKWQAEWPTREARQAHIKTVCQQRLARNMDLNRRILRHPFSRALWAEAWSNLKEDLTPPRSA